MATKEELQEQYAQLDTPSLIHIVAENSGYTELAMSAAAEELARRDVPKDEIRKYRSSSIPVDPEVLKNYLIDLSFIQKIGLYFLWPFRLRFWSFWPNFLSNGYKLKSQQSRYYTVLGLCFFMGTIAVMSFSYNMAPYTWPVGFVLSYFFDIGYNRQRQIDFLKQKVAEGKNPMDEFN